ncbi:uncharacterized protein LOC144798645 isoform X2 [Lissotriton helveticus]
MGGSNNGFVPGNSRRDWWSVLSISRNAELQVPRCKVIKHCQSYKNAAVKFWSLMKKLKSRSPKKCQNHRPEQNSCDPILDKNGISTKGLQFKEERQQLVDEIFSFLDNNKYVQENEALRIENRKLKNANSRLRYKTKDRDDLLADQIYQPGVGLQWDMKQASSKRDVSSQTLEEEISRNRFLSARAKKKAKNK